MIEPTYRQTGRSQNEHDSGGPKIQKIKIKDTVLESVREKSIKSISFRSTTR